MNRPIKFRAWDKANKEWLYFTLFELPKHWKDYVENICQFTGLTDKNGKEIYEGDVVEKRFVVNDVEHAWKQEVKFLDDEARFALMPGRPYKFEEVNREKVAGLEVIGNIYENPELLTK